MNLWWATFALMLTPIIETRGAIPLGLILGVSPVVLIALSALAATLIFIAGRVSLNFLFKEFISRHDRLYRWLDRLQAKAQPYIKRFGIPGLILFVAVPLPGTGAYGGTAASWVLGLDTKRSFVAVLCGAVISAGIITAIAQGVL